MEINDKKPEKDDFEEVDTTSDSDMGDDWEAEGTGIMEEEIPPELFASPEVFAPQKRRSLIRVALICVGLGILALVVFFVMKPEEKKPQTSSVRMKYPTAPVEMEKKPLPLPPVAVEEKVAEEKEFKVAEVEKKEPEIEVKEETKPPIATVKKPKGRTITKVKLPTGGYTVNVGSFKKRMTAERLMNEMKKKRYKAFVTEVTIPKKGTWYRVSMGRFPTREEAQAFAREIKEKEKLNTFVTELKATKR